MSSALKDRPGLVRECGRGSVMGRGKLGRCALSLEVRQPEVWPGASGDSEAGTQDCRDSRRAWRECAGEVFGRDLRVKATEGQSRERQKRGSMVTSSAPCCQDDVASSWPQSNQQQLWGSIHGPFLHSLFTDPESVVSWRCLGSSQKPTVAISSRRHPQGHVGSSLSKWGIHTAKTGTLYKSGST